MKPVIVFAALGDPTRLKIVEMLVNNGEMPVNAIAEHFSISAPAVSQHLKVLKNSNLVQVEVMAQQRIYSVNKDGICEIKDWMSKMGKICEKHSDAFNDMLKSDIRRVK